MIEEGRREREVGSSVIFGRNTIEIKLASELKYIETDPQSKLIFPADFRRKNRRFTQIPNCFKY
jgi:hypothetical protein